MEDNKKLSINNKSLVLDCFFLFNEAMNAPEEYSSKDFLSCTEANQF